MTEWLIYYNDVVKKELALRESWLNEQRMSLLAQESQLKIELSLANSDYEIANESYQMDSILYAGRVISMEEFRERKSRLIAKKIQLPQLESALISTKSNGSTKEMEVVSTRNEKFKRDMYLIQSFQKFSTQFDSWYDQHTIRAPIEGELIFVIPIKENQYFQKNKLIGFVKPAYTDYYAEIKLAQVNFGKVDTGQKVLLKLDAFPYREFGYTEGKINYITQTATDSSYIALVALNLNTVSHGEGKIVYKNGLLAHSTIITYDMTLLQRVINGLVKQ